MGLMPVLFFTLLMKATQQQIARELIHDFSSLAEETPYTEILESIQFETRWDSDTCQFNLINQFSQKDS